MKRILLASTAIVGFAGAAAADGHIGFSFSGDASLEYVDSGSSTFASAEDGFDFGLDINISATAELDNGLTAGAALELDIIDDELSSSDAGISDFVLSLTSDTASLFFGDTEFAAINVWEAAGDMEADGGFSEVDGHTVIRGEVTFGDIEAQVSYALENDDLLDGGVIGTTSALDSNEDLAQLSLGISADLGAVSVIVAYQEEYTPPATPAGATPVTVEANDFDPSEVFGLSLSGSFGGADVTFAYVSNETTSQDSTGIEVSYPLSDTITLGAYYVSESVGDDNMGISVDYVAGPLTVAAAYEDEQGTDGLDISVDYDLGNGLVLFADYAGEQDDDGFAIGGDYDLGSGASLRFVHVDADNPDGDNEYFGDDDPIGTSLTLSFSF